jgi:hypothetical protein
MTSSPARRSQIQLTLDELRQLELVFEAQWRRQPTQQEFDSLIEDRIKQEILYREGLAMGLDKDDEIVKRRMAQKMQFVSEDVAAQYEPSTTELRNWFDANATTFALPVGSRSGNCISRRTRAASARATMRSRAAPAPRTTNRIEPCERRSDDAAGVLRRPRAGPAGEGLRPCVRTGRVQASGRIVARTDRIRFRLASPVRRFDRAGAHAGFRRDRAGRQNRVAGRAESRGLEEGLSTRCAQNTSCCCRFRRTAQSRESTGVSADDRRRAVGQRIRVGA